MYKKVVYFSIKPGNSQPVAVDFIQLPNHPCSPRDTLSYMFRWVWLVGLSQD